jgi:hypothetical protein
LATRRAVAGEAFAASFGPFSLLSTLIAVEKRNFAQMRRPQADARGYLRAAIAKATERLAERYGAALASASS